MKKNTFKKLPATALLLSLVLLIAGCTDNTIPSVDVSTDDNPLASIIDNVISDIEQDTISQNDAEPEPEPAPVVDDEPDISTEQGVLNFMEGEWTVADPETGRDYAEFKVDKKGHFTFRRKNDKITLDGWVSFYKRTGAAASDKSTVPDFCTLTFLNVPDEYIHDAYGPGKVDETYTDGNFYFGSADGEDLFYYIEVGNGTSLAYESIIRNPENPDSYKGIVMHRKNDKTDNKTIASSSFYGWLWKKDAAGSLYIQKLKETSFEANEDYTNRRFTAAYFNVEDDFGIVKYKTGFDISLLSKVDSYLYDSDYQLMMCHFTTGPKGEITDIDKLDMSMYFIYDLGDLEPQFAFDGMVFTYNGMDYPLDSFSETVGNAIMACYKVSDKIVVEVHVNPHMSEYHIFDMNTGQFEKVLCGGSITWKDDDIYTAVYSQFGDILNYNEDVIYKLGDVEIYEISYTDNNELYVISKDGDKTYEEVTDPIEDIEKAEYYYSDYTHRRSAKNWSRFIAEAEGPSAAFVMENPQRQYYGETVIEDPNTSDRFVFVALNNDTKVKLASGQPVFSPDGTMTWNSEEEYEEYTLEKGEALEYNVVIPEGVPSYCIIFTINGKEYLCPIATLSGKEGISCRFIPKAK